VVEPTCHADLIDTHDSTHTHPCTHRHTLAHQAPLNSAVHVPTRFNRDSATEQDGAVKCDVFERTPKGRRAPARWSVVLAVCGPTPAAKCISTLAFRLEVRTALLQGVGICWIGK
jgi:hypothetical protein